MENRSSSRLAEWLDNLARESWQLELIISGFAIFLLLGLYDPLQDLGLVIRKQDTSWEVRNVISIPYAIAAAAWFILLINLCIHVVFRGLWISTVGLRSVSEDIDFDELKFSARFHRFLKERIGSFDRYIERLENICSVLFAFTFLILFMLLALGGMIFLMTGVNWALGEWLGLKGHFVQTLINLLLIAGGFLYFLDFVTLSRLKRIRWLTPLYYPIYRFFSFITFARLYRPLYYNLIDNRFGRRVGFLLVPYILILSFVSSLRYQTGAYFPEESNADRPALGTGYYDDLRPADAIWKSPSIPSRYVDNGFIELFLPYTPSDEDEEIRGLCPGLSPLRRPGVKLRGVIKFNETLEKADPDSVRICLSGIHRVFVNDSLHADPGFRFYTHPQREDDGLLAILDVAYLPRGAHQLRIEKRHAYPDTVVWEPHARIAFWKE